MKKNLLIVGLVAIAFAPLAARGRQEKVTIGIVQQMNHNSLNTISDAIRGRLAELGYNESNATILFRQGDNDMTTLSQIVEDYVNEGANVVIPIATKAANAALRAADNGIPVVFAACSDPVGSKLLLNMDAPEGNVTGTSDSIQVGRIIDFARVVNPALSKIGFIHTTGETNAQANVNKAAAYAEEIGLAYFDATIDDMSAISETIRRMYDEGCDAVFVPDDNTLAAHGNMAILSDSCIEYGLPLYCGVDSEVEDGGFATIGITYDDLGAETANMADRILKGAAVSSVPVKIFNEPEELKIFVNPDVMNALGINLPSSITSASNFIAVTPTN